MAEKELSKLEKRLQVAKKAEKLAWRAVKEVEDVREAADIVVAEAGEKVGEAWDVGCSKVEGRRGKSSLEGDEGWLN